MCRHLRVIWHGPEIVSQLKCLSSVLLVNSCGQCALEFYVKIGDLGP